MLHACAILREIRHIDPRAHASNISLCFPFPIKQILHQPHALPLVRPVILLWFESFLYVRSLPRLSVGGGRTGSRVAPVGHSSPCTSRRSSWLPYTYTRVSPSPVFLSQVTPEWLFETVLRDNTNIPDGSNNIGSTISFRGEVHRYSIMYTNINRHAGTHNKM